MIENQIIYYFIYTKYILNNVANVTKIDFNFDIVYCKDSRHYLFGQFSV